MVAGAVLTTVSYFVPNLRCVFWAVSSVIGLCGAVMVHTLDPTVSRNASLAGVYIMGFYNVPWVFMLSLQSSNTAGATKKSFMGVSVAIVYGKHFFHSSQMFDSRPLWHKDPSANTVNSAVGNIVGPQLFLSTQAPRYQLGISAMIFAFALMAAAGIVYYLLCVAENRRRDAAHESAVSTAALDDHGSADAVDKDDLTDIQNKSFRYTY